MDELELQGKKYISSKRASELTGYAKDYIGQLARGNKVPATRVGRAWYVEEEAILAHAGKLEQSVASIPTTSKIDIKKIQNENVFSLHQLRSQGPQREYFATWNTLTYMDDERDLIPKLIVREVPTKVEIHKDTSTLKNIVRSPSRTTIRSSRVDGINFALSEKQLQSTTPQKIEKEYKVRKTRTTDTIKPFTLTLPQRVSFVAAFAVMALVFGFGMLELSPRLGVSSQVASTGTLEFIPDFLLSFFTALFFEGIELIASFFDLLLSSIASFFESGLVFLLDLF